MVKEINQYRYISIILEITAVYCFFETYIGEYLWKGFYSISARVYVIIFLWLGFEILFRSKELKINPKYLYYFFLICFASLIINFSNISGFFFYIKTYLFPFLILYWVKQINSERFLRIFIYLFFFNVVLNIGWLFKINPLPNIYINALDDFAIGTVGNAFVAFIAMVFILYGYIYKKKLLALFSGFVFLMSNSFALFGIFIPVMLSATKFKIKHYLGLVLGMGMIVFSFIYLMPDVYEFTTSRLDVVSRLQFAKLELYSEMFDEFASNPLLIVTGFGPGERSSYASEQIESEFYNNNITYYSETLYIEGSSIMDKYYSGIASVLWETGLAGLLCTVIIFKKFLFGQDLTKQEKRLNIAFIVLFVLWSLVMDTFRNSNLSILYMMLVGILSNGIENQLARLKARSEIVDKDPMTNTINFGTN